jgi:tetratricopeptide (TPR) repeat protein
LGWWATKNKRWPKPRKHTNWIHCHLLWVPTWQKSCRRLVNTTGQSIKAKLVLELEPDSAVTHAVLGVIYQEKRMYAEAITEYKRALQLGGPPGEMRGLLGYAYAASRDRTDAERMIGELKRLWPRHTHAALDLAVVFSGLGEKEDALHWLEKADEMHVSDLIGIGRDAHFVELRSDRRFQALVQRVGGPQ